MALTVLQVAYPLAPVRRDSVGGAEQVLSILDGELVRAGHRSLVAAPEGSRCEGELVPTPPARGPFDAAARAAARQGLRRVLDRLLSERRIDLVHLHAFDFHAYLPLPVPTLATLHLPPAWYPAEALTSAGGAALCCVSETQRRRCPPAAPVLTVVPNGVRTDELRPAERRSDHLLCLGRICPEKGQHLALEAARRAGRTLVLAGRVFPYESHLRYFREEILPRLDARRRFVGPVGGARKAALLAGARCLLVPSLAEETSSLVAMEALACGTPVVAFPSGALPEIVDHGRTGLLVSDVDGMVDAVEAVEALDPAACRAEARARFSAQAMARRYLDLYRTLLSGARLREARS